MNFLLGWIVEPSGTVHMTGDTLANPAVLDGSNSILRGSLTADDVVVISSPATFMNGSSTALADAGTRLKLEAESIVESGADFSGSGRVFAADGSTLTLEDGTSVDVHVVNEDSFLNIGNGPATASMGH